MKHRIVPLTVVALCLGLPSLAAARTGDDIRGSTRDGRAEPRSEIRHEGMPGVRPSHIGDREFRDRYEERIIREHELDRARRRELLRDERRWDEERYLRAEAHRRAIEAEWEHVGDAHAARVELSIHADRMARLNRALDLAEEDGDSYSINRVRDLIGRENRRHARVMAEIRAGAL